MRSFLKYKQPHALVQAFPLFEHMHVMLYYFYLCHRCVIHEAMGFTFKFSFSFSLLDTPFGWGLGVGIMYMMSAGKAEINKLNTAMAETAKVVQELKAELHERKLSSSLHASSSAGEVISHHQKSSCKNIQSEFDKSRADNQGCNDIRICNFPIVDDGECASSVLTEEPEPDVQEMYRLETELESELQKLPLCTVEPPSEEGSKDLAEVGCFYFCFLYNL